VQLASVTERRLAGLVILAAAAAFVVLIVLAGPFFRTYDESKYVGIGLNVFAGNTPAERRFE
jgi:predicted permease